MKIIENFPLLPHNTFRMDVKAPVFAEYASVDELRELLDRYQGERILHIGAGSNLLFTKDFDGVILHSAMRRCRALQEDDKHVLIEAENGVILDDLIAQLCDMGLSGMENLSYIPGEVGASAVQNVGAYGVEAKDVIVEVRTLRLSDRQEVVLKVEDCQYGYRSSIFKGELHDKCIVTHVTYRLNKHLQPQLDYGNLRSEVGDNPTVMDIRNAVIRIRKQKLPEVSELGSAGSFFKNPIVPHEQYEAIAAQYERVPHFEQDGGIKIPAAWLIEQCGWKGKTMGGAQCFPKQPLVLVNLGTATPNDIINLAAAICQSIKDKFGITISPEVNYI